MRLKLILKTDQKVAIPLNYQYHLSSALYQLLNRGNEEYAKILHEKGYELEHKRFKLFTFSTLIPEFYKIQGSNLVIAPGLTYLYVGSLKNEFLIHFTEGLFNSYQIRIGKAIFYIEQVEAVPTPSFTSEMKFKCLAPIAITTKEEINGELKPRDCQLTDPKFANNIVQNLLSKYELIYDERLKEPNLIISFDNEDINKYRKGKLIQYKDVFVKGFMCPFTAKGDPRLMEIMWEVGAGEKNSGGFGMVDIVKRYR